MFAVVQLVLSCHVSVPMIYFWPINTTQRIKSKNLNVKLFTQLLSKMFFCILSPVLLQRKHLDTSIEELKPSRGENESEHAVNRILSVLRKCPVAKVLL